MPQRVCVVILETFIFLSALIDSLLPNIAFQLTKLLLKTVT